MKTLSIELISNEQKVNRLMNERFLPGLPKGYVDWITNDAFQEELREDPKSFQARPAKEYYLIHHKNWPEALAGVSMVSPPRVSFARVTRVVAGSSGFRKEPGAAEGYEYVDALCRMLMWSGQRRVAASAGSKGGIKAFVDLGKKSRGFYAVHFKADIPRTVLVHLKTDRCEMCRG